MAVTPAQVRAKVDYQPLLLTEIHSLVPSGAEPLAAQIARVFAPLQTAPPDSKFDELVRQIGARLGRLDEDALAGALTRLALKALPERPGTSPRTAFAATLARHLAAEGLGQLATLFAELGMASFRVTPRRRCSSCSGISG